MSSLTVPVDALDVIIHGNSQLMSTFCPAGFDNSPAVSSSHSCTKTMHAYTAADLGLVGSLWHRSFLNHKNNFAKTGYVCTLARSRYPCQIVVCWQAKPDYT
jgi:hypothetical protein